MKKIILSFLTMLMLMNLSKAQEKVQTVRGRVIDAVSKTGLPGANVVLIDSTKFVGVASDENGYFKMENIPIGRRFIKVSFIGYREQTISLIIYSAKEMIVEVQMEENYIKASEVVVSATKDKTRSNNEMSTVSSRLFTIEETERYAGSRGDPARMAMNYAGVSGANDQRNDIVIRGNSPSGLLWKLEDVDIPNPNHFSSAGSTGGPVSILNNNVLSNSDFMTGAFPAEYGNALSGVFDLKMRAGNNEKHEFLGQMGFNGVELGAEGPICRKGRSSYLANYRYSTLDFMEKIGMDLGTGGVPRYQDATWKLNFPTKKGNISFFGLAGTSQIAMLDSKKEADESADMYSDEQQDLYNGSRLFTSALSYTQFLNSNHFAKVILSAFYDEANTRIDTLDTLRKPHVFLTDYTSDIRYSLSIIFSGKFNSRISHKTGFQYDISGYSFKTSLFDKDINDFRLLTDDNVNPEKGYGMLRVYSQWQLKISEALAIIPGLHYLYYDLSEKNSLEPRLGLSWQLGARNRIGAGYGLHSRTQNMYTYLLKTRLPDGTYFSSNKKLDFTKAQHLILSFERILTEKMRFKTELYYQKLFDVPVDNNSTAWSILNSGSTWGNDAGDSLVNKGSGTNVGAELTLEKFFGRNYYFLFTTSLFDSKYKGSDGIERNSSFNGNYVLNALFGKEFPLKKDKLIFLDVKATYAGGKRYTPIDLEKSKLKHEAVYKDEKAMSEQFPAYFKIDVKFGFRTNGKKVTQEWYAYIENITDHKNVLMQNYSKSKNEVKEIYQLGFFPMLQWRIYF